MNTANVSVELRLKMFEGVDPRDIMYQDELDAINNEFEKPLLYTEALRQVKLFRG